MLAAHAGPVPRRVAALLSHRPTDAAAAGRTEPRRMGNLRCAARLPSCRPPRPGRRDGSTSGVEAAQGGRAGTDRPTDRPEGSPRRAAPCPPRRSLPVPHRETSRNRAPQRRHSPCLAGVFGTGETRPSPSRTVFGGRERMSRPVGSPAADPRARRAPGGSSGVRSAPRRTAANTRRVGAGPSTGRTTVSFSSVRATRTAAPARLPAPAPARATTAQKSSDECGGTEIRTGLLARRAAPRHGGVAG